VGALRLLAITVGAGPPAFASGAGQLKGLGVGGMTWAVLHGGATRMASPARQAGALAIVGAAGSIGRFTVSPGNLVILHHFAVLPAFHAQAGTAALLAVPAAGAAERAKQGLAPRRAMPASGEDNNASHRPGRVLDEARAITHGGFWMTG
jgi:hypothetical protein